MYVRYVYRYTYHATEVSSRWGGRQRKESSKIVVRSISIGQPLLLSSVKAGQSQLVVVLIIRAPLRVCNFLALTRTNVCSCFYVAEFVVVLRFGRVSPLL